MNWWECYHRRMDEGRDMYIDDYQLGFCDGYDSRANEKAPELTDEDIQDILGFADPSPEESRLIRLGWLAYHNKIAG